MFLTGIGVWSDAKLSIITTEYANVLFFQAHCIPIRPQLIINELQISNVITTYFGIYNSLIIRDGTVRNFCEMNKNGKKFPPSVSVAKQVTYKDVSLKALQGCSVFASRLT